MNQYMKKFLPGEKYRGREAMGNLVIYSDSERLAGNQRALLNAMPEMVLLINFNGVIEYMNPSAKNFFGDLCKKKPPEDNSRDSVHAILLDFVNEFKDQRGSTDICCGIINDSCLEYSVAPFSGYKGDDLCWLIIKDLTDKKKHQQEMNRFNENIESILSYKIGKLKESERVRKNLSNQLDNLKNHLEHHPSKGTMVGSSDALREIRDLVFQTAKTDTTILISGESGTGKELVANLIHKTSNRSDKPFLKINCNTISDSLLESDLFGFEKGAFTGAHARKKGKFEAVDEGTIFLDEIGDISPRMQGALLRVLQDGEIFRVGGNSPIKVNVRVIVATNVDLAKAVQQGKFRLDLFYRLNIINIKIPPLRERKGDIIDLAAHFLQRYCTAFDKKINGIPETILEKLTERDWPGNIRELENVMQRAVLMCKTDVISSQDLFFDNPIVTGQPQSISSMLRQFNGTPLKGIIAEVEKEIILNNLEKYQGNVAQVADSLDIGKTALYDKMKRYEISAKELR